MPSVSVIIPTYNRVDTLPRAIDSALAQTIHDIEVIIVDDGSTDETAAIVEEYADTRVRFFQHDQNRNGAAARNTGIEHADGEYIAFLDSDDAWRQEKLERQLKELRPRCEEWVGVYCEVVSDRTGLQRALYTLVTTFDPGFQKRRVTEKQTELVRRIHTGQSPIGGASTLLIKTDAVREIDGFDSSFSRHQDSEFLIRLLKQGQLAVVAEELVVRYSTGIPDLDTIETAKQRYFTKFQAEIQELEAAGVPVAGSHRLSLARYNYQRGRFQRGTRYLCRSRALNLAGYLRVLWSIGIGLRWGLVNAINRNGTNDDTA